MEFAVATDGSTHSEAAIEHALALAEATGGRLSVLHVRSPTVTEEVRDGPVAEVADAADRLVVEDPDDAEERGERILDDAARVADDAPVPVRTELLEGDPVEAVVEFAEREGVNGIVVGHRGLSERYEDHLGSVAKSLVTRSPVPVTVVGRNYTDRRE